MNFAKNAVDHLDDDAERELLNAFGIQTFPPPTDNERTEEGGVNVSEAQENSIAFGVNPPVPNNVASTNNGLGGNEDFIRNEQDNNMTDNGPPLRVNQGTNRVPNELVQRYDVLFQTGQQFNNHPGNELFNDLLNEYAPRYRQLREREENVPTARGQVKTEKGELLDAIVQAVHASRARFLFKKKDWTGWEVKDTEWARNKVSSRLRDIPGI